MLQVITGFLGVCANFIIYIAFGSLITVRKKDEKWSLALTIVIGFFLYYSIFFFFCVPMMLRFQTLTSLAYLWLVVIAIMVVLSGILKGRRWYAKAREIANKLKANPLFYVGFIVLCLVQVLLITNAYNFTLDATYYVGNVATSVLTDTMNIYDPYTGMWQDHFEMRYFFATYSMNDAVICRLSGLKALIQTKTIMTASIIMIIQCIYFLVVQELFREDKKAQFIMLFLMTFVNFTFITIYTSHNFLLTRTFEGKAVVANLVLVMIAYLYMLLLKEHNGRRIWWYLFIVCFGSTTISSSANMLVPAALSVFMLPLIFIKKDIKILPKYVACILPGFVMTLIYVAYVKGYFVIHTY